MHQIIYQSILKQKGPLEAILALGHEDPEVEQHWAKTVPIFRWDTGWELQVLLI